MPKFPVATFSIPSTGGGTYVVLVCTVGNPDWQFFWGAYIDEYNNVTDVQGNWPHGSISVSLADGIATVSVTTLETYNTTNKTFRCCFIPGNPFPPVGEPV